MTKIEKLIETYSSVIGKDFPLSFFEFMKGDGDDSYSDTYLEKVLNACIESKIEYIIDERWLLSYELYLAEKEYFVKFGTESPRYRMTTSDRISLLRNSIKTGNQLPEDGDDVNY